MKKWNGKMQRQRRVPGGRKALPACVLKEIERAVENEAKRFHVSKSFVVAVALADAFGVKDQERYVAPLKLVKRA